MSEESNDGPWKRILRTLFDMRSAMADEILDSVSGMVGRAMVSFCPPTVEESAEKIIVTAEDMLSQVAELRLLSLGEEFDGVLDEAREIAGRRIEESKAVLSRLAAQATIKSGEVWIVRACNENYAVMATEAKAYTVLDELLSDTGADVVEGETDVEHWKIGEVVDYDEREPVGP